MSELVKKWFQDNEPSYSSAEQKKLMDGQSEKVKELFETVKTEDVTTLSNILAEVIRTQLLFTKDITPPPSKGTAKHLEYITQIPTDRLRTILNSLREYLSEKNKRDTELYDILQDLFIEIS